MTAAPLPSQDQESVAFLSLHASPLARLGQRENGGLSVYVRAICAGLGARGVGTDVFVRRTHPDQPGVQAMGPLSRVIAVDAGPPRSLPKAQLPLTRPAYLAAVRRLVHSSSRRYLAIHSHYWLSADAGAALAAELGTPWLHTAHTLAAVKGEFGFDQDGPERLLAERRAVAQRARLVANTEDEVDALVRLYGAEPEQCVLAPPGVDLVTFQPREVAGLRSRLGLEGRQVVLFAGRLEPLKGPDTLLDAFALLRDRPGPGPASRLLLVGELSSEGARVGERRELLRRAGELGLDGSVSFLGAQPQDRLALLYSLADVVVMPSHTESFGLVALEAQACGTPVVGAAVGGLPDIIANGRTGYLVEGRDPGAYAEAITRVLEASPGARERMRQAAWERAQGFTWERTVELLLPEYGLAPALAEAACQAD